MKVLHKGSIGFFLALTMVMVGCGGGESADSGPAPADPSAGPVTPADPDAGAPGTLPSSDQPGAGSAPAVPSAAPGPRKVVVNGVTITAEAGVKVEPTADPTGDLIKGAALAKRAKPRPDPFALLAAERRYEEEQSAARISDELGGFTTMFKPEPEPPDEGEIVVPAPPGLRLAGIILGNGVVALLEWQGRVIDIRPGTRVDQEWVVASIDEEKAVLRRLNNKRPREIVVPLASRLDIGGSPAGGGDTQGGGNNQGRSGPNDGPGEGGERGARGR